MTNELSWINETKTDEVEILPPVIQWRRGDLTNENPLLKNGCWQFQAEEFSQILNEKLTPIDVVHGGGVVVPSYLMSTINIAVLVWKKRWFIDGPDGKPVFGPYVEGAKSRMQIWAIVKELDNTLAMISVRGLNGKYLSNAIFRDLNKKIITPMHRHFEMNFSRYHFWLPLSTGGKMDASQSQYITPPVCSQKDFSIEALKGLLTGEKVSKLAKNYMIDAKKWAETKEPAVSPPEIAQPQPMQAPPEPPMAPFADEEIPF